MSPAEKRHLREIKSRRTPEELEALLQWALNEIRKEDSTYGRIQRPENDSYLGTGR